MQSTAAAEETISTGSYSGDHTYYPSSHSDDGGIESISTEGDGGCYRSSHDGRGPYAVEANLFSGAGRGFISKRDVNEHTIFSCGSGTAGFSRGDENSRDENEHARMLVPSQQQQEASWDTDDSGSRTEQKSEECEETAKLSKFHAIKIIDHHSELHRQPSFPFLHQKPLTRNRKTKDTTALLRGPRRVLRLCLFAVVVPLALVLVSLYIRIMVYPPQLYAMAPSDQRLVDSKLSSIWCQGQSVQMNGTFNAYLIPHMPKTSRTRPRFTILRRLDKLKDDVKEYWGFYLKTGSTVTLSVCTRWNGGQLMILRGSDNLHRCAWIGEEDSLEESYEHSLEESRFPSGADRANLRVDSNADSDEFEDYMTRRRIGSRVFTADKEKVVVEGMHKYSFQQYESSVTFTSEERQMYLNMLLKKAVKLSKGKSELLGMLDAHHEAINNNNKTKLANNRTNDTSNEIKTQINAAPNNSSLIRNSRKNLDGSLNTNGSETNTEDDQRFVRIGKIGHRIAELNRLNLRRQRSTREEDHDGAFEETDDVPMVSGPAASKKYTREEIKVEQIIGGIAIPKGLTYERGYFNLTNGYDFSGEESTSSYSSSEEALASCEGVILALPLQSDSSCTSFEQQESNKITYDITVDGTYYFVFSSDNEIMDNDIFFNLTLDKVVFDTSDNLANCTSSTNCSLKIGFWTDFKTVVEVPGDGTYDTSYVLSTTCEPRVAVYLCLMLLVPMIILFCAFQ